MNPHAKEKVINLSEVKSFSLPIRTWFWFNNSEKTVLRWLNVRFATRSINVTMSTSHLRIFLSTLANTSTWISKRNLNATRISPIIPLKGEAIKTKVSQSHLRLIFSAATAKRSLMSAVIYLFIWESTLGKSHINASTASKDSLQLETGTTMSVDIPTKSPICVTHVVFVTTANISS